MMKTKINLEMRIRGRIYVLVNECIWKLRKNNFSKMTCRVLV